MAVMLSDLLRNLTFNRSAHCTQVSDQCPLGLLFIYVYFVCTMYASLIKEFLSSIVRCYKTDSLIKLTAN